MSETSGQEKTEQATPKRLEDARKKGQVPRSKELSTAAVMLASAGALMTFGPKMITDSIDALKDGLTYTRTEIFDPKEPVAAFGEAIGVALQSLLPFFVVVVVAAICAPAMTGGWSFSTQAMAFKAEKLNPLKGIKRMFSVNALVELFKALAKFGVVGSVAVVFLYQSSDQLMSLSMQPMNVALTHAATMGVKGLLIFSTPLLIIAAVDVPFQLFQHSKQMRMTRQEVRDEMKETDGNPEMKGRIRQMQMEQANARMMDQVSLADVIITNPTHFAVALQYDPNKMAAPRVVAKGADLVAARIREIARENNVPLLEAPPLARALFRTTELNQEIPAQFFTAVAQILTWVFQLKHAQQQGGVEPTAPNVLFDESSEGMFDHE